MSALVERKPEVVLRVEVPGDPVAKARPRVVRTKTCGMHTFTPDRTAAYEQRVLQCALSAMAKLPSDRFPLDEPIGVRIRVQVRKPKKPAWDAPAGRSDLDNYVKAQIDGLQLARVFVDDARIVQLQARKDYGEPGVLVEVLRWR